MVLMSWCATRCGAWRLPVRHFSSHKPLEMLTPICRFRFATPEDIPFIDQCNRKTLPENYSRSFFQEQLARFPSLSIVAETIDSGDLMGYVLGRLKEPFDEYSFEALNKLEIGHCGSIAVYEQYRGKGIAEYLMNQLHYNLAEKYRMDKISLLVRPSNTAAYNLYSKILHYETIKEEKNYYPDGENAFYMVRTGLLDWHRGIANSREYDTTKKIDLKQ